MLDGEDFIEVIQFCIAYLICWFMNTKKHMAKLSVIELIKKSLLEREERINRVVFNMATFRGPVEYLEAIARATKC